jgi:hypothetical protein
VSERERESEREGKHLCTAAAAAAAVVSNLRLKKSHLLLAAALGVWTTDTCILFFIFIKKLICPQFFHLAQM